MPQGDKSKYTARQKRMAEHIEEGYEDRGFTKDEAERRAWATVNKETGGGQKKGGSGYHKPEDHEPARKGGEKGAAHRTEADRSAATKKGFGDAPQKGLCVDADSPSNP